MTCYECEERRRKLMTAIMRGKMAEAAGHVVAGARHIIGLPSSEDNNIEVTADVVGRDEPGELGAGDGSASDGGVSWERPSPSAGNDENDTKRRKRSDKDG